MNAQYEDNKKKETLVLCISRYDSCYKARLNIN